MVRILKKSTTYLLSFLLVFCGLFSALPAKAEFTAQIYVIVDDSGATLSHHEERKAMFSAFAEQTSQLVGRVHVLFTVDNQEEIHALVNDIKTEHYTINVNTSEMSGLQLGYRDIRDESDEHAQDYESFTYAVKANALSGDVPGDKDGLSDILFLSLCERAVEVFNPDNKVTLKDDKYVLSCDDPTHNATYHGHYYGETIGEAKASTTTTTTTDKDSSSASTTTPGKEEETGTSTTTPGVTTIKGEAEVDASLKGIIIGPVYYAYDSDAFTEAVGKVTLSNGLSGYKAKFPNAPIILEIKVLNKDGSVIQPKDGKKVTLDMNVKETETFKRGKAVKVETYKKGTTDVETLEKADAEYKDSTTEGVQTVNLVIKASHFSPFALSTDNGTAAATTTTTDDKKAATTSTTSTTSATDKAVPQTGDNANVTVWVLVGFTALAILGLSVFGAKKFSKKQGEGEGK